MSASRSDSLAASTAGPKPFLCACQAWLPAIAPIPVRITSPLASTTSMPHMDSAWLPPGR